MLINSNMRIWIKLFSKWKDVRYNSKYNLEGIRSNICKEKDAVRKMNWSPTIFSESEWTELTQIGPVSVLYKQDLPVSVGEISITSFYTGVQD